MSPMAERQYWRPFSLRLPFLILFGVTFLFLIPALLLIRHFADIKDGFALVTSNHYTWTYGPTAVFIILTSLWRLVDYHCKALLPWAELATGPAGAERTILLDYVSPMIIVSLVRAGKHRHYIVLLTILGFFLLKIVTLASTALFFPSPVLLGPYDVAMIQSTRFDNLTNFTNVADPGAFPFYTTYAVVMRNYSLPEGVASTFAYEQFQPVNDTTSSNTTYTASTGAFIPQVQCDVVDAELEIDLSQYTDVVVDVQVPFKIHNDSKWTCSDLWYGEVKVTTLPVASQYLPPRQIVPTFSIPSCNLAAGEPEGASAPFLVALSDLHYTQTFNVSLADYTYGDILQPVSWNFTVPTIRAMLCQTSYSLGSAQVSYNMSGTEPVIEALETSVTTESLDNFSNTSIAGLLSYADPETIGGARDLFGVFSDYAYVEQPPDTIMDLVAARAGSDYIYLLDNPDEMLDATENILTTMMVFLANDVLLVQTNSTFQGNPVSGQKQVASERLQVQPESLYLMIAGIILLLLLIVSIIFLRPKSVANTNLETTSAMAQVIRDSPEIQQELLRVSTLGQEKGQQVLKRYNYHIPSGNGDVVMYKTSSIESDSVQEAGPPDQRFHTPMTLRKWFLILLFSIGPIIIILLEVLQHISDTSDGIISLEGDSSLVVSIYSRYLPALVMLLTATLFNSFDSNTAILAPFNKMYAKPASSQALVRPLIGQLPITALYNAFRNRYWSAFLTGIAAIIGSVLTIVVSGLYTTEYFQSSTGMSLTPIDSFNVSFHQGTSTDNATAATSSLIESDILSYPKWTYDELVFPTFSVSNSGSSVSQTGVITAQIPALQADLDCVDVSFSDLNFTTNYVSHYGETMLLIEGIIPLPDNCQRGSSDGNLSYVEYSTTAALDVISNSTYLGLYLDLHVGPFDVASGIDVGEIDSSQPDNPAGCPALLLIYGYFDGNVSSNSVMTAKRCDQKIKKLSAEVTINVPDMSFVTDNPPYVVQSDVEYVSSGQDNQTAFWWRLEDAMDYSFQISNSSVPEGLTGFFNGVLNGNTPIPIEALGAGSPITSYTPEETWDHVLSFYRRYMAQYISANMRISVPTTDTDSIVVQSSPIQGSYVDSTGTPRMVQNRTPKLVLQIMLAIMLVCCVLAYYLGRYHNIVPWNPCTIAGVMVLLSGSKMCRPVSGFGDATARHTMKSPVTDTGDETIGLAVGEPGEHAGNDSVKQPIALTQNEKTESSLSRAKSRPSVDHERLYLFGHYFRLGWWRGGQYMGPARPSEEDRPAMSGNEDARAGDRSVGQSDDEIRDTEKLRYGIDML